MAAVRLAVVIPTRNRPELALRAVESVLTQRSSEIDVVVSDNSTSQTDRSRLASRLAPGVPVLVSPGDLGMADHWNWAVDQAQERLEPTHVTFLTDRMVFKTDVLHLLLAHIARMPDSVLTYNHDSILDANRPVHIDLEPSSWRTSRISSQLFLDQVAHGTAWQWTTPRMLNCIAPVALLESMRSMTGTVFGSVAPDFYFGFRVAALVDEFLAWDAPLLVHYALRRSNGHSQQTGESSPDGDDFKSRLQGYRNETPFPTVHTLSTAMFHEYAVVARETGSAKFRPLDREAVARAIRRDVKLLIDEEGRRAVLDALGGAGLPPVPNPSPRGQVNRIRRAVSYRAVNLARRALRSVPAEQLPAFITESPVTAPYLGFASAEAALDVAVKANRVRLRAKPPRGAIGARGEAMLPFRAPATGAPM